MPPPILSHDILGERDHEASVVRAVHAGDCGGAERHRPLGRVYIDLALEAHYYGHRAKESKVLFHTYYINRCCLFVNTHRLLI